MGSPVVWVVFLVSLWIQTFWAYAQEDWDCVSHMEGLLDRTYDAPLEPLNWSHIRVGDLIGVREKNSSSAAVAAVGAVIGRVSGIDLDLGFYSVENTLELHLISQADLDKSRMSLRRLGTHPQLSKYRPGSFAVLHILEKQTTPDNPWPHRKVRGWIMSANKTHLKLKLPVASIKKESHFLDVALSDILFSDSILTRSTKDIVDPFLLDESLSWNELGGEPLYYRPRGAARVLEGLLVAIDDQGCLGLISDEQRGLGEATQEVQQSEYSVIPAQPGKKRVPIPQKYCPEDLVLEETHLKNLNIIK